MRELAAFLLGFAVGVLFMVILGQVFGGAEVKPWNWYSFWSGVFAVRITDPLVNWIFRR